MLGRGPVVYWGSVNYCELRPPSQGGPPYLLVSQTKGRSFALIKPISRSFQMEDWLTIKQSDDLLLDRTRLPCDCTEVIEVYIEVYIMRPKL